MTDRDTLPKGWAVAKLEDVCEILDGRRKPINASEKGSRASGKNANEPFTAMDQYLVVSYLIRRTHINEI